MFGIQLYIIVGTNRYGLQFVPFHWTLGSNFANNSYCVGLGPFIVTAEENII